MTAAYDEFMRQYKLTGSEKADGYSRAAFVGLNPNEKEEVFELLMRELPHSAEWLFFLEPKKAFDVVKEEEAKMRGNEYAHVYMLQRELIKYSGDLSYQNHMIEDYACYTDRLKPQVVTAVSHTPMNTTTLSFFRQVILTETNSSAVARAALAFLDALGLPCATEAERSARHQLKDELCSENVEVKMRTLTRLAHRGTVRK